MHACRVREEPGPATSRLVVKVNVSVAFFVFPNLTHVLCMRLSD
jgi:hypothetical protein